MPPGRNEPCYCGSGRRYKHCHGALAVGSPADVPTAALSGSPAAPGKPGVADVREITDLVAMLQAGRLAEVESSVTHALQSDSGSGLLWKLLAVAQLRQGKDAMAALRRAAALLPGDAEAQRNLGSALHDQGQWEAGLEVLQAALALEPAHPDALLEAADCMRGLGRVAESVALYQKSLAADPRSVEAHNNLGNAFLELRRPENALGCYESARALRPNDARISCNLSEALRQARRFDEALAAARDALALRPGDSMPHQQLGSALAATGEYDAAIASFRRALEIEPRNVDAQLRLGTLLRDRGDRRGALALLRQALELAPRRAEAHCDLGTILFELRQVADAAASYRRALQLQPRLAAAHLGLAFLHRQQRQPAEAEASCRAALEAEPTSVEGLTLLGELLADRGQFAEAEKLFVQAMSRNADYAPAYASLATHRRMTEADGPWLSAAQRILSRPLPVNQDIALSFAIGKYYDDLGRYDEAFTYFRRANEQTRRLGARYDRRGLEERLGRSMRSAEAARRWRVKGAGSEIPVLVIGMPRSGTTLVEQILASHPQIFGAGEVSFWNDAFDQWTAAEKEGLAGPELLARLAGDYSSRLIAAGQQAARVIDKMPANFMYAGLIHAALPRARFIHMRRQPLDTCLSIYCQNFHNIGAWANDLGDLAHYYAQYRRVMEHWRGVLDAQTLLEVPYEDLVSDPERWSRRMIEFIGLPWDARCLQFQDTERAVITASKWQVRQKISTRSVGRWRNYARHLEPLRELEPQAGVADGG